MSSSCRPPWPPWLHRAPCDASSSTFDTLAAVVPVNSVVFWPRLLSPRTPQGFRQSTQSLLLQEAAASYQNSPGLPTVNSSAAPCSSTA
eukprot:2166327-Rhodomonas_salina.2